MIGFDGHFCPDGFGDAGVVQEMLLTVVIQGHVKVKGSDTNG